ncbi:MAG: ATP synthase subunit C [Clostridiales bacterium]|jgi:V/A-type H+-transporting ATPase subunit K|nr:ATP synthase subunit C [Clostridiales bacterium]
MLMQLTVLLLILSIILPAGILLATNKKPGRVRRARLGLAFNVVSFFGVLIFSTIAMFSGAAEAASVPSQSANIPPEAISSGLAFIGAGLSVGLGSLGAGIATGNAAAAALGALSENEGIMAKALVFVALAEGVAIYGFVIAFMILNRV